MPRQSPPPILSADSDTGLSDLAAGRVTPESLTVSLAAPRLRREGVPVGAPLDDPKRRLFRRLSRTDGDVTHARYDAHLRQFVDMVSIRGALPVVSAVEREARKPAMDVM